MQRLDMKDGLVVKTCFLAGRLSGGTARISRDSAVGMASGASRAVAWSFRCTTSLARVLDPLYWLKVVRRRRAQRRVLEISAAEQRRIGRILHDGVGQILSGVAFMSRALQRKLASLPPDGPSEVRLRGAADDAAQIAQVAEKGMDQTRSLARVLDPVRLKAGGLASLLGEMASDIEKVFDVTCTFEHDGRVSIDDEAVAMHLYCIAREAVTNAIRHGGAKHVVIGLSPPDPGEGGRAASSGQRRGPDQAASSGQRRGPDQAASSGQRRGPDQATLTVRDDGIGFEMAECQPDDAAARSGACPDAAKGMGLRIMGHRAKTIGGELTIRRRPEGGALVACTFPNARRKR